jgi:hypothetical protein
MFADVRALDREPNAVLTRSCDRADIELAGLLCDWIFVEPAVLTFKALRAQQLERAQLEGKVRSGGEVLLKIPLSD